MEKTIWKLIGKLSYFLGNVLVEVRFVFLPDCSLVLFLLSLFKHKSVGVFLNLSIRNWRKKKSRWERVQKERERD